MTITCFIRSEIDPFRRDSFTAYAENWARIIPRRGEHLLGRFVRHESGNYEITLPCCAPRVEALQDCADEWCKPLMPMGR